MFPGPKDIEAAARDPRQGNLLDPEPVPATPPPVVQAKRYVYALVTRDTNEIRLPVHPTRREANEARTWSPDADTLKVERCRLVMCRR